MFHFYWPWVGVLLFLPFLLALTGRVLKGKTGRQQAFREPALLNPSAAELLDSFGQTRPRSLSLRAVSRWVRLILKTLIWGGLIIAMMRPQWLEPQSTTIIRGYDLMLAVDCSRSMEALDFSVNGSPVSRMAVVKGVMGRFVSQREGDRLGLVVFGDNAYVQSPLTADIRAVRSLLDSAVPRMAGDATAIGDAIALAVKKLRDRPESSRVLILITDGENTSGMVPPLEAVKLAAHYGVRIYSIGVGSLGKRGDGYVPFMVDGKITDVLMEIDEALLQQIAKETGGAYFRATDTDALEQISARIAELEKTESETRTRLLPTPLYRWPLAVALMALLVLALITPQGRRP